MPRRFWTDRDLRVLRARYAVDGPTRLAEVLGRTPGSVAQKAYLQGVRHDELANLLTTGAVAAAASVTPQAVRAAARRDGVDRVVARGTGRARRILVPEAWAERYIHRARERRAADDLHGHHYTTEDLARLFGVAVHQVQRWREQPRSPIANVRRHRGTIAWYYNPYDTEEALTAWRASFEE